MNNKLLPAAVLAVLTAPVFAQSPDFLRLSFDQALSGLKVRGAQIESVKGAPAAAAAQDKVRYAMFASIRVQSRELVKKEGNKALLKFKASLLARNFGTGIPVADQADVEFLKEVAVSENGGVNAYIVPQLLDVKLYIGEKFIGVGNFDKGSFAVSGKVTDKKVRVSGTGRIWGWVDFLEPR